MPNNNPFYSNPGNNPYTWNNAYTPGASYAPQTGGYMAGNQTPNLYQNQSNRFQSIPGRLVSNLDEITPQEVPMDGSVSLFPQNDYSAIYAKTWTKDGTIATVKFVPEQPASAVPQKSPIEERLDRIDQRFDHLEKMLSNRNKPKKPYNKSNQGKEEQSNA